MSRGGLYLRMLAAGVVLCVGGPALVYYVTPTEEELFKRYNPELQKKSLENRQGRQQDFNTFVNQLKEYSKSDKPSTYSTLPSFNPPLTADIVWEAAAQDEARKKSSAAEEQRRLEEDIQKRREEIKRHSETPEKH